MGFLRHWVASVLDLARDRATRPLIATVAALLATGTVFYAVVERWTVIDALYFCVITLTTVGYGDLAPRTVPGKLFTIVYILAGLAVILAFVNAVVSRAFARRGLDATFLGSPGRPAPTDADHS